MANNFMAIILMKSHDLKLNSKKWGDLSRSHSCRIITPERHALTASQREPSNSGKVLLVF